MKAVVLNSPGPADELRLADIGVPSPGAGEVLVKVVAAGVNFMDLGVRQGLFWKEGSGPIVPGVEGAGRVVATGAGVEGFVQGDRVAWAYVPGSYAEYVVAQADALVHIPSEVDDRTAAAVMMQGLTATLQPTFTLSNPPTPHWSMQPPAVWACS